MEPSFYRPQDFEMEARTNNMDILKPEDKALELLAAELGFIILGEKIGLADDLPKEGIDEKNRQPAMIKPFTQLT
jgi:hypothetical protein